MTIDSTLSLSLNIKSMFSSGQTNEWLIGRFTSTGERKLFEQLYDNCSNDLYHFLLTLSDHATAKDICQKTWLKVFEKPHLYSESGRFLAWLFTLARHALIDELRKSQRLDCNEKTLLDLPSEGLPNEDSPALALADAFNRELTALPFEQREAFCLQQEGFGLQEIAKITYSKIETVKSRLRYAKSSLRKNLEKYHD